MIRASGIILVSPQGRVLMLQRSKAGDMSGTWAFPGGKIEAGESEADAAVRETWEEVGYRVGSAGKLLCTRVFEDVHFTTFLAKVDEEFTPKLNDEHDAWGWFDPVDALSQNGITQPAGVM